MLQTLEIDVDHLMQHLRASRKTEGSMLPPSQTTAADHASQGADDLAFMHSAYDIYHLDFISHRNLLGWVVVRLKQSLQQLLTPIFERQCAFNLASARVASELQTQVSRLQDQASHLQRQMAAMQEQQATILLAMQQQIAAAQREHVAALQALRSDLLAQMQTFRDGLGQGRSAGDDKPRALEK
jgi:hypothetical protein